MNAQPTETVLRLPATLVEAARAVADCNGMTLESLIVGAVQREFESKTIFESENSQADITKIKTD